MRSILPGAQATLEPTRPRRPSAGRFGSHGVSLAAPAIGIQPANRTEPNDRAAPHRERISPARTAGSVLDADAERGREAGASARPGVATGSRRAARRDRGTRRLEPAQVEVLGAQAARVDLVGPASPVKATRDSRACGRSSVPIVQSATSEVLDLRAGERQIVDRGCRAARPRRASASARSRVPIRPP